MCTVVSRGRRAFLHLVLGALTCVGAGAQVAPGEVPNIVLILADDLGIGDSGAYNEASKIPTPHLDRLAAEGVRFTDAHSPSAVCTPTRYAILTGEYAWRTRLKRGVLNGYSRSLVVEKTTMAEMLRSAGYKTACVGKWHLGLGAFDPDAPGAQLDYDAPIDAGPHTEGFEYSYIVPASLDMAPYVYVEDGAVVEAATDRVDASASRRSGGGGFWRAGAIAPSFEFEEVLPTLSDRAVGWIGDVSKDEAPFFLYMPLTAPHTPWMPTEAFSGVSEAGAYGDFVAQVDGVVGEVRAALARAGVLEETLVIVTSDNGAHWTEADIERYGHRANGGWRGQKADIHEGGHRVPLIVRWPGQAAPGTTSDALVGLQDLFATLGEVAGAAPAQLAGAVDSVSFLDAVRGGAGERETLICHSLDGMFAVRRGRWKFIEGLGSGGFTQPKRIESSDPEAGQLYDLVADPGERDDLFGRRPEVVAELRRILEETRR